MIRPLTGADALFLQKELNLFFSEIASATPPRSSAAGPLFAPDAGQVYADLYLKGTGDCLALCALAAESAAAEPVGLLLGRQVQRPARLPARAFVIDVAFTRPDFRARGTMSALLEKAYAWCEQRQILRLELGTPARGPAREFWARRGFGEEFVQMGRMI